MDSYTCDKNNSKNMKSRTDLQERVNIVQGVWPPRGGSLRFDNPSSQRSVFARDLFWYMLYDQIHGNTYERFFFFEALFFFLPDANKVYVDGCFSLSL